MIAILDRGRIAQIGTPLDIVEHPASDFVRDFVGVQGIGLKLLSVRKVADRLRPGESAEGAAIPAGATLAEALETMIARRANALPVSGEDGTIVGAIGLADLVR
jgi:osmoprotectant transport system ATP-binding protein